MKESIMNKLSIGSACLALLSLGGTGCGDQEGSDGGTGNAQVFVVPEDTIANGLEPGTDLENIQDGWTISYSRYLVAIGNFRAKRSDTGAAISDPTLYVLDLKSAPSSGYVAKEFTGIAAVRWDKFGFDIPTAKAGMKVLAPTQQADADFMISNGYSVYYEGTASKDADTISFKWGFQAGTSFDDCATEDKVPGFAVPSGGTVQVKPTLHGDHQYFSNVSEGVENTKRLAQWLKTCNADANAELTLDELKKCDIAVAMPPPTYDLSAITDQDGDGKLTVYDYVNTQMRTFGDYQGDGECPTRAALP
jgi:hypothetical protein